MSITYIHKIGEVSPLKDGSALLLGNFDGVHLGHQELIKEAKRISDNPAVLLFDKNPAKFFGHKSIKVLTSLEDKMSLFKGFGVNEFVVVEVSPSFFALTPGEFIEFILKPLNPSSIVVGTDYSFGKNGSGNNEILKEHFDLHSLELLNIAGEKVSSQTIIKEIEDGDIEKANGFLGRDYFLKGEVVKGFGNGKKIGYPTANISLSEDYALPKVGVYKGYASIDGQRFNSIINVGKNPTIGKLDSPIVEAHILDFDGDIYGKMIEIGFISYLRGEKKFSSLEELKKQLDIDRSCFD